MGSPIQINALPVATVANDNDVTLLRQGSTDYQCAVGNIRNNNLQTLLPLPTSAVSSDLFMINRVVNGLATNYRIPFSSVGFTVGTQMWFYMTSVQITANLPAWQIVPNTGDALLACQGGSTYISSQSLRGTWTPASFTLNVNNLPPHNHTTGAHFNGPSGFSQTKFLACQENQSLDFNTPTSTVGLGTPVQPPNTWRPLANVGNICQKIL